MKTALISDTHNLLRPEALAALQGCDQIIHPFSLLSESPGAVVGVWGGGGCAAL